MMPRWMCSQPHRVHCRDVRLQQRRHRCSAIKLAGALQVLKLQLVPEGARVPQLTLGEVNTRLDGVVNARRKWQVQSSGGAGASALRLALAAR